MARLFVKRANKKAKPLSLGDTCIVGRDPSSDCILKSTDVSRRHARIEKRKSGFFLCDLGSRNGTYINGQQLTNEIQLKNKDQIRIGRETLQFFEESEKNISRAFEPTEPLSVPNRSSKESTRTLPIQNRSRRIQLPKKLGKFYLVELLGKGGMGKVFLAKDLDSSKDVAVKFILSKIGRQESFLDFFHNREAVLARQIDHPNVIRVFEHGVFKDEHFISMEYIKGQSLYQLLKVRRPEVQETIEILRQATCGLYAAHQKGVVHSDIKPANILINNFSNSHATNTDEEATANNIDEGPVLEFNDEFPPSESEVHTPEKYDPGLLEEINKRTEIPSRDILLNPPHFERASEMRFLEHYHTRLEEGRGFFLLIDGEKGSGKTRLINEFLTRQQSLNKSKTFTAERFLSLDCSSMDCISDLFEKLHSEEDNTKLSPQKMVEVLCKKIGYDNVPTVLHITQLECLDPLISKLVTTLTSSTDSQPILLIADIDSEEVENSANLRDLLKQLKPFTKELFLRLLTEYQIQRYLTQILKTSPPLEISADLYRLTRGNFSKLLEAFKNLINRGHLNSDPSSGQLSYRPNQREFELEEGKRLYEMYQAAGKVEQLVIDTAAFLGYRFFFEILQQCLNLDETSLFFILRSLTTEGFFIEEEKTWFRFSNTAFQKFLAERIPPHERPHRHRKTSYLLHTVKTPPSAELYQMKAQHYLGCKEYDKAVQNFLEGAYIARIEYNSDQVQDMYHDILKIYRKLSSRDGVRKNILQTLREWFSKDGNWYEILGKLAADENKPWVKIADFGISFRMEEGKGLRLETGPIMGTPRYMAPERAGKNRGGLHSDIFAMGIIAYEMVVGEPPFPDLKGFKIVKNYQKKPIQIPKEALKDYPDEFEELLRGMLEINPEKRWDTNRVLKTLVQMQYRYL